MNVLIVEDEAPAARRLRRLVAAELAIDADSITLADSVETAVAHLRRKNVDLMLLDLDLSGRDGFIALRSTSEPHPPTVIVSANTDRALEAFDHEVVDFVSKPVSAERLNRALERAGQSGAHETRLIIRSLGRTEIVSVVDVLSISGADDYVEVVTNDGRRLLHYDRLDGLARRLPSNFIRTHRSHIINTAFVQKMVSEGKGKHLAVMTNGNAIPVSRRRASEVKKILLGQ